MANYAESEIMGYAQQIIKNMIGAQTKIKGIEWSGGRFYNEVSRVNTTDGDFILKIERDKIFFSTRKEQTENDVYGNELCQKAGIPCANILAYDFTKNDIGVKYVFMEHIINDMGDAPLWGRVENFDEVTKVEIKRQFITAFEKQARITSRHFGSLSPSGILGRHETYDGYHHSTLNLLINDSIELGLFTDEELDIVKKAAAKPLIYSKKYIPTFQTGDQGWHNAMWGNTDGGADKLYMIDFGNSIYGLPYDVEYVCRNYGIDGIYEDDADIPDVTDADENLNEVLIASFNGMFHMIWTAAQQLMVDDTHGDWHARIEAIKRYFPNSHDRLCKFMP